MQLKNIDGASEAVSAKNRKERANERGYNRRCAAGIEEDGQGSDGKGVYFQRDFCLHDEPDPVGGSQISGQPLGGRHYFFNDTPLRVCGAVDSSAVLFAADNSSKHAYSAADKHICSAEYESGCAGQSVSDFLGRRDQAARFYQVRISEILA